MNCVKIISEIFYNFAVGAGAIMAGFTGIVTAVKYFSSKERQEQKRERARQDIIESYKKQYPVKELNKTFKLVSSPIEGEVNKVYILDIKKQSSYWVGSRQTFNVLQFPWERIEKTDLETFKKYTEGEKILIDEL